LAFERLRFRDLLSELGRIEDANDLELVGRVFASIDEIEAAQYGEIARGRLQIIRQFTGIIDANEKERVIQDHIFDHLWLLDPSWERASTNARIEESVMKEFGKIDAGLTEAEKKGRFDIRYRTAAGKHVIIELKRYAVKVSAGQLLDQLGKYRRALEKCLKAQFPDEPRNIECIAVVGTTPEGFDPAEVGGMFAAINARVVTYDGLIRDTIDSYEDYLESHKQVSHLADLLARLEEGDDGLAVAEPLGESAHEGTAAT
jgi:hypothetical protein